MKTTILIMTILMGVLVGQAQSECDYRTKEVDEFTGNSKVVMNEESFISHTDSSLMKYYKKKKKQYLEIECYAAKINETHAIYFYATFQTKSAYDYYGTFSKGSKIILKMANGEMIDLIIGKSDYGDTDYDRGTTVYSTFCIIDEEEAEALKSADIEKVRIYWSKGYESYDCDNPDLLKRQLNCLDN